MILRKKISPAYHQSILHLILVLFFIGCPASNTCIAANDSQVIIVGSELDFPPYAFTDENGQIKGFSVDLIKAVTDAMGLNIKITTGTWDEEWNSLVKGRIDILPIVAKLPERMKLVDFSLPHTETFDAFFTRKGDSAIPNIAAARGKTIVVMRSDAAHQELLARNFRGNLILVDTIPAGLSLISSEKYDAFLCSKLIGTLVIKKRGLTGIAAGPIISDYKRVFSFAVKKGDADLLEKLNQGLLIVKANGEYEKIYNKWLTFEDSWQKIQPYVFPVLGILIVLVLLSLLWLFMLRRQISHRTRELAAANELLRQARDEQEKLVQERTKELRAFYNLSGIIERKGITLDELYEEFVKILPASWQYTNVTCARIVIGDREFRTKNFAESQWMQSSPVKVNEEVVGRIDVGYLEERPENDEGPFLKEERQLINALAERLGHITERKRVEEALVQSKHFLNLVIENTPNPMWISDEDGTVIMMNEALRNLLKIRDEEIIGIYNVQKDIQVKEQGLLPLVKSVFTEGKTVEFTIEYNTGKEKQVNLQMTTSMILDIIITPIVDKQGKVITAIAQHKDITERKRAEEEILRLNAELEQKVDERTRELHDSQLALLNLVDDLNQSAKNTDLINRKLEETNNELNAFSYSVSHDLRAPLRSIDGFSLALMEDYQEKLDDTGRNYIHRIRAATQHMGMLIEDMLKLSRITHVEFHHESIDLSKMAQSISDTLQKDNPDRNIKIVIHKDMVINGDFNSMDIALTNLLGNAWKFTGKQKNPSIKFGMTFTEGRKVFFIQDNGAGFDMAYAGKLFGAFQRLHGTDEFPGTGIGLATVKRIITRHGGQIWAEGEVGKGATFFFTIPE